MTRRVRPPGFHWYVAWRYLMARPRRLSGIILVFAAVFAWAAVAVVLALGTQPVTDEFIAATDVADLLVRRGVPFREAHGIVGGLVRGALERGKDLSELSEEELAELAPQLDRGFHELLEHRWFLSEREGREVSNEEALADYVTNELPARPTERTVLGGEAVRLDRGARRDG